MVTKVKVTKTKPKFENISVRVLERVFFLIKNKKNWLQGNYVEQPDSCETMSISEVPIDEPLGDYKFCIVGAIGVSFRMFEIKDFDIKADIYSAIRKNIVDSSSYFEPRYSELGLIAKFNDVSTHKEVLDVLRKTIKELK